MEKSKITCRTNIKKVFCKLITDSVGACLGGHELLYVTRGAGELVVEGAAYPLSTDTIYLSRPMTYRIIKTDAELEYCSLEVFFGSEDSVTANLFKDALSDSKHGKMYSAGSLSELIRTGIDRLGYSDMLREDFRAVFYESLTVELLLAVCTLSGNSLLSSDDDLGARVRTFINENLTSDLSLDRLERVFFVSKHYLCRAFKHGNGTSIHGYITEKRIAMADAMIESGELASDVAYKVGFGDYSAFYRAYVKHTGTSPTARHR